MQAGRPTEAWGGPRNGDQGRVVEVISPDDRMLGTSMTTSALAILFFPVAVMVIVAEVSVPATA